MQAWAYAMFRRGANLTGGPLSQSKVQQQPLGMLADSSEGEWHTETGRPRQRSEQRTDAVYGLQGQRKATCHKAINCVCVDATAPYNCPVGRLRGRREVKFHIAWRVMTHI